MITVIDHLSIHVVVRHVCMKMLWAMHTILLFEICKLFSGVEQYL